MASISKPYTFSAGATIIASEHNSNFDTIYNDYNGNITNANIAASAAIVDTKLAQITTASKVSGTALTSLASVPSAAGFLPSANSGVPLGMVVFGWPTATAPSGWILCAGSAVSRTTYALLFAVVGTDFGSGDGSTTFNVPDNRGKFPFAKAASGTGSTLLGTFGAIDHTHTGPSHTHTGTTSGSSPNNNGASGGSGAPASDHAHTFTSAAGGTGNTGTGNPPGIAYNSIIYAGV